MQASPASALLCCSFAAFLLALLLLSLLLLGCTDQTHRSLEALQATTNRRRENSYRLQHARTHIQAAARARAQ